MRKTAAFAAAAIICGALFADGYVYQIRNPIPTVSYPAVSEVETLVFGGWGAGAAAAQDQTSFAGWTRALSSASALDARKPSGTLLLFR